jgi:hypothetical protein
MQTYYEDVRVRSPLVLLTQPHLGQMCVAKYSDDNQWYRALVKDVADDLKNVRVFFIDYGNEEIVPVNGNLLILNEKFRQHPPMAIRCCLNDIKPHELDSESTPPMSEIVDYMFNSMTENVPARFVSKLAIGDCYMVNVTIGNTGDLSQLLIDNGYAVKSEMNAAKITNGEKLSTKKVVPVVSSSTSKGTGESKVYPEVENKMSLENKCVIIITAIETINEFYVQIVPGASFSIMKRKLMFTILF